MEGRWNQDTGWIRDTGHSAAEIRVLALRTYLMVQSSNGCVGADFASHT